MIPLGDGKEHKQKKGEQKETTNLSKKNPWNNEWRQPKSKLLAQEKKTLKTRLHGQIDNLAAYLCSSERICRLLDARKPSELDGICAASLELLKSEVSVVCTNGIQVISLGLPYVSYVQQWMQIYRKNV